MRHFFRFFLIGTLTLALLAAVAAGLAFVLVKPEAYTPQLIAAVKKATGRTLALQGDFALSLFPTISVQAGPAELEDDPAFGPEPFVLVTRMSAQVALLPLFRGSVQIDEVVLEGVRVKLAVSRTGRANWEIKPDPAETRAPDAFTATPLADSTRSSPRESSRVHIVVSGLRVRDMVVTYRHMDTGAAATATVAEFTADDLGIGRKGAFSLSGFVADENRKQKIVLVLKGTVQPASSLSQDTFFSFSGQVDATRVSGEGSFAPRTVDGAASPMLAGRFLLGDLDLDRYLPAVKEPAKAEAGAGPSAQTAGNDPARVKTLRHLTVDVTIAADSIVVSGLPLRAVQAGIQADKGEIRLFPCTLTLAEGSLVLDAVADARGQTLRSAVNGTLRGARVEQIVQAVTGRESLRGNLDLSWNVSGIGTDWPAISRSLQGRSSLLLTGGLLPGFQLIPEGIPGLPARREDVHIDRFSGTWRITGGTAISDDIALQATTLRARAAGSFSVPAQIMDYRVAVYLPVLPEIPARVSGPLSSPVYTVDTQALLRNSVEGLLQSPSRAGETTGKAARGIGRTLKGIFSEQPRE